MKILRLTLTRKWFDEIASGRKKEEYREMKPHWDARLKGKRFDAVLFVNGYRTASKRMLIECRHITTTQHAGKECYAIALGDILEIT